MNLENNKAGTKRYKKVMVVDDTFVDRYIAERIIKKYDFAESVILLDSGTEALEYLHAAVKHPEEFPEIIFLDMNMPGMDGFAFLDEYERFPSAVNDKCAIIILSTLLKERDREKAELNPYVNMILDKPLDKESIAMLLTREGD